MNEASWAWLIATSLRPIVWKIACILSVSLNPCVPHSLRGGINSIARRVDDNNPRHGATSELEASNARNPLRITTESY